MRVRFSERQVGGLTSTPAAVHAAMTLEPFTTCTGSPLTKHSMRSSAAGAVAWKARPLLEAAQACDIALALLAAFDACCASRWSAMPVIRLERRAFPRLHCAAYHTLAHVDSRLTKLRNDMR